MGGKWLTPDAPPADKFLVRRLVIPADYAFIEILNGALVELTYAYNFEESGALSPDETAALYSAMYDEYIKPVKEAPGWEDGDDVDGSSEQPWYNDLADWIIEGFLAISGFPQAAIIYSTTIPKLRIAIQQHDLGSLIKILLNNLEMYTGDTYAPIKELVGQTLDLAGFAAANNLGDPPWELRIVHDGPGVNLPEGQNGFLHVVRKRWVDEMPIQFRQDDPCLLEYSEDDGQSWNTAADLTLCVPPAQMMTGAIIPWPVETTPDDWLRCDGSEISRETYADLFNVLGGTWGIGDGVTTFNLPDFRDRALIGDGTLPGNTARTVADVGGEESHTLTVEEMPSHHHTSVNTALVNGTTHDVLGTGNNWGTAEDAHIGGDEPHNNMPPFAVVGWIIKV